MNRDRDPEKKVQSVSIQFGRYSSQGPVDLRRRERVGGRV